MYNNPYMMSMVKPGLFSKAATAFRGINFGSLLDGAGKTLGVINQAIPIVYQVKPIINNAKTMFKIADELKNTNTTSNITNNSNNSNNSNISDTSKTTEDITNRPIFYI